jgi:hypothetical protein
MKYFIFCFVLLAGCSDSYDLPKISLESQCLKYAEPTTGFLKLEQEEIHRAILILTCADLERLSRIEETLKRNGIK